MKFTDDMLEQMLSEHAEKTIEILDRSLPDADQISPHVFSRRFKRRMRRLIHPKKRPCIRQIVTLKKAAVFIMCVSFSLCALSINVEAAQTKFLGRIVQVFPDGVTVHYSKTPFSPVTPEYIPKGLSEIKRKQLHDSFYIEYRSENGDYLNYKQFKGNWTYDYNPENAENTPLNADENAVFVTENDVHRLIWVEGDFEYEIASSLSKEEMIKTAESVKSVYLSFSEETSSDSIKFVPSEPTYIPKGFSEYSYCSYKNSNSIQYLSEEHGCKNYLTFEKSLIDGSTYYYSSENAEIKTVQFKGIEATLVRRVSNEIPDYLLMWVDKNFMYSISASDISENELIQMARSVRIKLSHSNGFTQREAFSDEILNLPENLECVVHENSYGFIRMIYQGQNGDYLKFFRFLSDGTDYQYNLKDAAAVHVNKDRHAVLITENDKRILIWEDGGFQYNLISNLPKDELIDAANNVCIYINIHNEFTYSGGQDTEKFVPSKLKYLPDGMKEFSRRQHDAFLSISYQRENGDYLDFEQGFTALTSWGPYDQHTEDVQLSAEQDAVFVSKNGVNILLWSNNGFSYTLTSSLPKEELIKTAQNVIS